MIKYFDAVSALVGGNISGCEDGPISEINFHDGETPPTEKEIQAKLTELKNAEPMRLLRQQRNWKLSETDWWCASDQTPTKAQLDYRKSLRDLPSTASPSLDEKGNLKGVEWPTKPE
jgi:hypothetical protein